MSATTTLAPPWTIVWRGQTGVNGTWTVTARRGSQVVTKSRLTAAEAEAFDPQAAWEAGR